MIHIINFPVNRDLLHGALNSMTQQLINLKYLTDIFYTERTWLSAIYTVGEHAKELN